MLGSEMCSDCTWREDGPRANPNVIFSFRNVLLQCTELPPHSTLTSPKLVWFIVYFFSFTWVFNQFYCNGLRKLWKIYLSYILDMQSFSISVTKKGRYESCVFACILPDRHYRDLSCLMTIFGLCFCTTIHMPKPLQFYFLDHCLLRQHTKAVFLVQSEDQLQHWRSVTKRKKMKVILLSLFMLPMFRCTLTHSCS